MQRAFSFPVTVERSRAKERLEASLSGLCELELRRQRQEALVLGALALGEPGLQQENWTLRRQLSALQSSPWGLMQALEQQVGELRIDTDNGSCDGAPGETADSRPSSGFYESSEGQSPKGKSCCAEPSETVSLVYTSDRPKSVGDPLMLSGEYEMPAHRTTLPRSFSAPYPPLEGIAEEGSTVETWQWDPVDVDHAWQQEQAESPATEEDYQQAFRVEGYILSLVQRHTLSPRPCQPRTTLSPDPPYSSVSGHSSLHRRAPSLTTDLRLPDNHLQPHGDLSADPQSQGWGCDPLEAEACGGEGPPLEEDCYLAPPHPQSRPHSLTGRQPSPLPSLDPNCAAGALDLCCDPSSPQHYLHPHPLTHRMHHLVNAQYIPGQACHAPVRSPRHYSSEQPKHSRATTSPNQPNPKPRPSKKGHNERQRSKKSGSKAGRSHSENSLLGQREVPERRYSTTERHTNRGEPVPSQNQVPGPHLGTNSQAGPNGNRRWCSNVELSQDEGEAQMGPTNKRPPRKGRQGHSCSHQQQQQHIQRWHQDFKDKAPLCRGEEGYAGAGAAPPESESSMSEVYSPASSSLSSDSDESGGLVWPQQLPPRLASASASSSSSPSPKAAANAASQPKAFVKIKASHALKKKILRFRSGSLKVMTTV